MLSVLYLCSHDGRPLLPIQTQDPNVWIVFQVIDVPLRTLFLPNVVLLIIILVIRKRKKGEDKRRTGEKRWGKGRDREGWGGEESAGGV